jgi:SHS family lactate transporter-like MFS transporter
MSGVLQGSWGLGFALSALAYGFLFDPDRVARPAVDRDIAGPRRVWIRFYEEPEVWVENRRQQREIKAEVKAPLLSIFKRGLLFNTLTACFLDSQHFLRLLFDLGLVLGIPAEGTELTPLMVATPLFWPTSSSLLAIACGHRCGHMGTQAGP